MTVGRSEIADVESFEDVLLMAEGRLHGITQTDESLSATLLEHTFLLQPACRTEAQAVVRLVGIQVQQILLHAADGTVDRHIVVVENNQEVVGRRRSVVQSFESQSARHRAVADNRHDMSLGVALQTSRHGHTQGSGDAVRRMSACEGVVFALER